MTFEQVDKHVEKTFTKSVTASPKMAGKASAEQIAKVNGEKLKSIYTVVKPILQLVAMLPIIPKNWRTAVQALVAALDVATGQGATL